MNEFNNSYHEITLSESLNYFSPNKKDEEENITDPNYKINPLALDDEPPSVQEEWKRVNSTFNNEMQQLLNFYTQVPKTQSKLFLAQCVYTKVKDWEEQLNKIKKKIIKDFNLK